LIDWLEAEREVVGQHPQPAQEIYQGGAMPQSVDITAPATEAAKKWDGWGTALKPAVEEWILAMKPLDGTFAVNALKHGVAGLNIDGARIGIDAKADASQLRTMNRGKKTAANGWGMTQNTGDTPQVVKPQGRWPANLVLSHTESCRRVGVKKVRGSHNKPSEVGDGSGKMGTFAHSTLTVSHNAPDGTETVEKWECVPECPVRMLDEQKPFTSQTGNRRDKNRIQQESKNTPFTRGRQASEYTDTGGASRFFYTAKASRSERELGLRGHIPCIRCGDVDSEQHITDNETKDVIPLSKAGCGDVWSLRKIQSRATVELRRIKANKKRGSKRKPPRFALAKCVRNNHPTVKPLDLMEYLCRLTRTPDGGMVLDVFAGSGTTLMAAKKTGRRYVGIDSDQKACEIAKWLTATVDEGDPR